MLKSMPLLLRLLLPSWVKGITIPPFGIFIRKGFNTPYRLAHESTHWSQYQRLGLFKFYFLYLYYTIRYGYTLNPLEVEARRNANAKLT